MQDEPRRTLADLIQQHGRELASDYGRLEALLRDYCGTYRREISVLVSAAREGVPRALLDTTSSVTLGLRTARLVEQLQDDLALERDAAVWAVDAWAEALGVVALSNGGITPRSAMPLVSPPVEAAAWVLPVPVSVHPSVTDPHAERQATAPLYARLRRAHWFGLIGLAVVLAVLVFVFTTVTADRFKEPRAVAVDNQGNVYVTDAGNHRVLKFGPDGKRLWTSPSGPGDSLGGIVADAGGTVYVLVYGPSGGIRVLGASDGSLVKMICDNGQCGELYDIAVDPQGNLYVTSSTKEFLIMRPSGQELKEMYAVTGTFRNVALDSRGNIYLGVIAKGGLGSSSVEMLAPDLTQVATWDVFSLDGIAVGGDGAVYVIESGSINKLTRNGTRATVVKDASHAQGLAVDGRGNIYVAETYANRMQKRAPDGSQLAVWDSASSLRAD